MARFRLDDDQGAVLSRAVDDWQPSPVAEQAAANEDVTGFKLL